MHQCLSCNQPCHISAIFCEPCRLALLERSAEEQGELTQSEVREVCEPGESSGSEGLVELAAPPQVEESAPLPQTEGMSLRFWRGASRQGVKTLEPATALEPAETRKMEVEEAEEPLAVPSSTQQATNLLPVAIPPARHPMPKRIRRALLVFGIVALLAFTVDGVLLALSIMRHHGTTRGVTTTVVPPANLPPGLGATATTDTTQAVFSLSSTRLLFTAVQGQQDPAPQTVTLFSGNKQAFAWSVVPVSSTFPNWLHLSAAQGNSSGMKAQVIVSTVGDQLEPGTYAANLLVRAFDTGGKALSESPQSLAVVLVVQKPCNLTVSPLKLSFAAVLLSPPSPQILRLSEIGDCAQPITWRVSADQPWITFASSSGTDTGAGSIITVQASSSGKLIGSYTANMTLTAIDAHGVPLTGSPVVIVATLTVLA